MSLQACADIIAKGDPDRFAATMAAPVEARPILLPLYAMNVEVARAPWVVSEPMIGEMRLQWWRDALEEIAEQTPVRNHEVTTPLAEILDPEGVRELDALVTARRWDLYRDPFEDQAHFDRYLSGGSILMWTAARLLGAEDDVRTLVQGFGRATALVRFLQAVPALEIRGRVPLIDGRQDAIRDLAHSTLSRLPSKAVLRRSVPTSAHPALLEGWQTRALLAQIVADPGRVARADIKLSEFRKRLSLLLASF